MALSGISALPWVIKDNPDFIGIIILVFKASLFRQASVRALNILSWYFEEIPLDPPASRVRLPLVKIFSRINLALTY